MLLSSSCLVESGQSLSLMFTFLFLYLQSFVLLTWVPLSSQLIHSNLSLNPETTTAFKKFVLDQHLTAFVKSSEQDILYSMVLYDTSSKPELNVADWLIQFHGAVSLKTASSENSKEDKDRVSYCLGLVISMIPS